MSTPADDTVALLPSLFRPRGGAAIPDEIVGARIVGFGTFARPQRIEGGGLVIDYVPAGQQKPRRVVLAFNELGMWVESCEGPNTARSLK